MSRAVVGVLFAALLATSACTSTSSTNPPEPIPPGPNLTKLIRAADLAPCPPSTSATVPGGLPDVTLPCLGNGPKVHLAGLRGEPLVLNIWGSWCGPCQKETPYLAQAYDELKTKVRFLGVDDEDQSDSALDFAAHVTPPMRYPSVVDENKSVLVGLHGHIAVPSTVFVDADGKVVQRVPQAYSSLADLRADIARYLGVQA